jgi:hypothetical protein
MLTKKRIWQEIEDVYDALCDETGRIAHTLPKGENIISKLHITRRELNNTTLHMFELEKRIVAIEKQLAPKCPECGHVIEKKEESK